MCVSLAKKEHSSFGLGLIEFKSGFHVVAVSDGRILALVDLKENGWLDRSAWNGTQHVFL